MKRETNVTVIGRVVATERMNSSDNGNPRYLVVIQDWDTGKAYITRTNPDSMLAYAIDNPEYRDNDHVFTLKLKREYLCNDHVFTLKLKRGYLCIENVQTLEDSPEVAL